MSNVYLAEIRVFSFNFAPRGWAFCNGQTLSISQFTALFSILGTSYGGNGTSTFQLPNLQGNVAVGQGQGLGLSNYVLGETLGVNQVILSISQVPGHTHQAVAGNNVAFASQSTTPTATSYLGREKTGSYAATANSTLAATAIGLAGGNQAHSNTMPTLAMNCCIAMEGIFPTRN
jgi:microcystin-dependent protein